MGLTPIFVFTNQHLLNDVDNIMAAAFTSKDIFLLPNLGCANLRAQAGQYVMLTYKSFIKCQYKTTFFSLGV